MRTKSIENRHIINIFGIDMGVKPCYTKADIKQRRAKMSKKIFISENIPQYKANLHSHSTLSDGALTPRQLKDIYKARGYSILAITDHNLPCDHSEMNEDGFMMLTGYEEHIRENVVFDMFSP